MYTDLERHAATVLALLLKLPHTDYFTFEYVYKQSYRVQFTVNKHIPAIAVLVFDNNGLDIPLSEKTTNGIAMILAMLGDAAEVDTPEQIPAYVLERGLTPRLARGQLAQDIAETMGTADE